MYQTHIANIDELKHWLVQVWAELDHRHIAQAIRQWQCHLNECDVCAWKLKGDILNNVCIQFTLVYLLN